MPQRETIDSGEESFGDDNGDKEEEFLQPVDINATKDELIKVSCFVRVFILDLIRQ